MTSASPPRLVGLQSTAYEHPEDRALLNAARRIKGFDTLVKLYSEYFHERGEYLLNISGAMRVSPRQHPRLYRLYKEMVHALDMPEPEVFVHNSTSLGAFTSGAKAPWIVLNSGLLYYLSDREVQFVIAHELGHIKSGHVLYNTMLRLILSGGLAGISAIPGVGRMVELLIQQGVVIALMRWSQKAEFTADRAAALAVDDAAVSTSAIMKLAGAYHDEGAYDVEEFIRQADEFEDISESGWGKLYNFTNGAFLSTHPYLALRAKALREWHADPLYRRLFAECVPAPDAILAPLPAACPTCGAHAPHRLSACVACRSALDRAPTPPPSFRRRCPRCEWPHDGTDHYCLGCGERLGGSYFHARPAVASLPETRALPFGNAYFDPAFRPAESVLPGPLGKAVTAALAPDEHLRCEVEGSAGGALVFTDRRVLTLRAGLPAPAVHGVSWTGVGGLQVEYTSGVPHARVVASGGAAPGAGEASVEIAPASVPLVRWLAAHLPQVWDGSFADLPAEPLPAPHGRREELARFRNPFADPAHRPLLSGLPGGLGQAITAALHGERLCYELHLDMGYGLALTEERLLLVKAGRVAGVTGPARLQTMPLRDVAGLELLGNVLKVRRHSVPGHVQTFGVTQLAQAPDHAAVGAAARAEVEWLAAHFAEVFGDPDAPALGAPPTVSGRPLPEPPVTLSKPGDARPPAPAPTPAAPSPAPDAAARLERLWQLKEAGALTAEEFEAAKRSVLASG